MRALLCTLLPLAAHGFNGAEERPPARMQAKLAGLDSTGPYSYFSRYLDAGVPPSGRGKVRNAAQQHACTPQSIGTFMSIACMECVECVIADVLPLHLRDGSELDACTTQHLVQRWPWCAPVPTRP